LEQALRQRLLHPKIRFMSERSFQIVSSFKPTGDQPAAIAQLTEWIRDGKRHNVLLGATGTGKTFTMANVIQNVQKTTLIISHNKTLAAQLYEEMKDLFPHNAVSYFVSYYDYYQPEAYIPQRDIYIEKDSSRNDDLGSIAACRHQQSALAQGCDHRRIGELHFRSGFAGELSRARARDPQGPDDQPPRAAAGICRTCSTSATELTSSAASSACAAM
jgi:hypothetical protein